MLQFLNGSLLGLEESSLMELGSLVLELVRIGRSGMELERLMVSS